MTVSETITKANRFVNKVENDYVRKLAEDFETLKDIRPVEADMILAEIIDESERRKPLKYDEENDLLRKLKR